jgi:hypothetical protein
MRNWMLWLAFAIITLPNLTFAQQYNIRGFVSDQNTGEAISDQKVTLLSIDSSLVAGAMTDPNGLFTIPKLDKGDYILRLNIPGYMKTYINVTLQGEKKMFDVAITLPPTERAFDEVTVTAESKTKKTKPEVGIIKFDKRAVERIPVYGAESDILGAVSVTPGVTTTGDQGGQFYVRGGTPIQNKTLLDGMTIYNPFHSIGFFSIFETELVKSVDIYTGGFESKYGGRVSSIMDISYRDGDRGAFGGKVSVSPFLAKMVLEGPLSRAKKGRLSPGSYVFTAKHSLLDYTSKSLYPRVNEGEGLPFNFTDLYGKVTFTGDGGSKVSFFGFHNRDSVNYQVADLNWQASGGGINFLLIPSGSPTIVRGHVNGSNFLTTFNEDQVEPRYSKIGGFDLGFDFSYFLKNEGEMNYGFNFCGFNTEFVTYNEAKRKIELFNFNTEIGAYFNYRRVSKDLRWVLQAGFRVQAYASLSTVSPEPRLGVKYNASDNFRIKFSGGRYSQNFTSASSDKDIVNLFNGLLSAPTNVQEEFVNEYGNTKDIKNGLQYAWHGILGLEYDLNKHNFFNVEGYYKYFSQLSNINQNKLYEDLAQFANIADVFKKDFIIESGTTYGVDLLYKLSLDRFFFWGVYSYSISTRWDGFVEYYPVFDRRHNVNVVGSYQFGEKKDLELNVRWNLGSGLPFTPTAGFYQAETFNGGVTTDYVTNNPSTIATLLGTFNSRRLPYYHRLDITLKKNFKFKNKSNLEITGNITNAYNRKNIFYVNRITSKVIYQFPILPSLGISYIF